MNKYMYKGLSYQLQSLLDGFYNLKRHNLHLLHHLLFLHLSNIRVFHFLRIRRGSFPPTIICFLLDYNMQIYISIVSRYIIIYY